MADGNYWIDTSVMPPPGRLPATSGTHRNVCKEGLVPMALPAMRIRYRLNATAHLCKEGLVPMALLAMGTRIEKRQIVTGATLCT